MSEEQTIDSQVTPANHYPVWSPRFWHGMRARNWWKLLAANRFQVELPKLHIAVGVSFFSPMNDLLGGFQKLLYGRKIEQTEIEREPVFIIGHWRSGTTLLHELLVTDEQFAYPNTLQCFAPDSFLLSEPLMIRLGGFLLPKRRPMDNMKAGWRLPQEDEFALMNLGIPTPYLRIAFPKSQDQLLHYLDMQELSTRELEQWQSGFEWFLKALTFHYGGKRLVLKSPTHTGRVGLLAQMYPNAKFVHLTRDPVQLFSSTIRLWQSLEAVQALQSSLPREAMVDYVIECHKIMYRHFEASRTLVEPANIVDLRYEDLAADPLEAVRRVYESLELGDFSEVQPALEERLEDHHQYQPNRHTETEAVRSLVLEAWPEYAARYGYGERSAGSIAG